MSMYTFDREPTNVELAASISELDLEEFQFEGDRIYRELLSNGTDEVRAGQMAASIATKRLLGQCMSEAETNAMLGLDCLNDQDDY